MTIEYIAGFFDGEGSVLYNDKTKRVKITISQTNKEVLVLIKDYLGYGNVYNVTKRQSHWKDAWVYVTNIREECLDFIDKVYPFLIVKKEEALKVKDSIKILQCKTQERIDKYNLKKDKALSLIELGLSYREIQKQTGIGRSSISRMKKKVL